MIKGVILDFSGVVVESKDLLHLIEKEFGIGRKEFMTKSRECGVGKMHYGRFLRWLAGRSGKPKGEVAELMRRYYSQLYEPKKDLKSLATVRQRKVVLTNAIRNAIAPEVKKIGLRELVDDIVVSSGVGARKPDARMYRAALKALGTRPGETLYVGDEQEDLDGAKKLGIKTAFIPGLDKKAKADYHFSSLGELARFLTSASS